MCLVLSLLCAADNSPSLNKSCWHCVVSTISRRLHRAHRRRQNWTISSIKRNLIQLSAWTCCVCTAVSYFGCAVTWKRSSCAFSSARIVTAYEFSTLDLVLGFLLCDGWKKKVKRNFYVIFFSQQVSNFSIHLPVSAVIEIDCSLSISCKPCTETVQHKFHWIIAEKNRFEELWRLEFFGILPLCQ